MAIELTWSQPEIKDCASIGRHITKRNLQRRYLRHTPACLHYTSQTSGQLFASFILKNADITQHVCFVRQKHAVDGTATSIHGYVHIRTHGPPLTNEQHDGFRICLASHFGQFSSTGSCSFVLTPNSCMSVCSAVAVGTAIEPQFCTLSQVHIVCFLNRLYATHFNNFSLELAVCWQIHKPAAVHLTIECSCSITAFNGTYRSTVGIPASGHPYLKGDTTASFHILSNSSLTKHAVLRRHTITDTEGVVQKDEDILK